MESSEERRFVKSLKERQESDMKAFLQQQKNDYRSTKLMFKKVSDVILSGVDCDVGCAVCICACVFVCVQIVHVCMCMCVYGGGGGGSEVP